MRGNLHINYEKIIDYIYDNIRFGSTVSNDLIEELFIKYPITYNLKQKVYNELRSLDVTIDHISKNTNSYLLENTQPTEDKTQIKDEKLVSLNNNDDQVSIPVQNRIQTIITNKENTDTKSLSENTPKIMISEDYGNLDMLLSSDGFKNQVKNSKDAIDKKYNLEYISEAQSDNDLDRALGLSNIAIANTRLVWKITQSYKRFSTSSFDINDMYQAGMIGLLRSINKFDSSLGYEFSTYATWWIRQSITRSIADYSLTIRVPVHMREKIIKFTKIEREYENNNDSIDDRLLAEKLNVTTKTISELRIYRDRFHLPGLDMPIGENGDTKLGDLVEDTEVLGPEKLVLEEDLGRTLTKSMKSLLKDKERRVLEMRFGLCDGQEHTLQEIGEIMGVTRERIRQIEAKAIEKLNKSKQLEDYRYGIN